MSLVANRSKGPQRPRRSALTVPGSSERMIQKSGQLPADQLIYDLEDAVAPAQKERARAAVAATLAAGHDGPQLRSVRVNGIASGLTYLDLQALLSQAGGAVDTVVVPKVSDAGQLAFIDHLLSQLELSYGIELGTTGIEVQLEDAAGLLDLPSIMAVTPRLEALTYGPGDLAAALGLPPFPIGGHHPSYPGDHWHHVHLTLLLHARRAGIHAVAGPYVEVKDLEGFEDIARRTRGLGFDGVWVLHPDQIEVANRVFGVDLPAFERAVDLLDAYTHAVEVAGHGAVLFGGEMIDEATRRQCQSLVSRGRAEGLEARPVPPDVPFEERRSWRSDHLGAADNLASNSSDV